MTRSLPGLELLARRQADVVTRAQLAALGADRHLVARRIEAGVWRSLGPRVVVLHRGQLTRTQQWWVGVLHATLDTPSTRAALCGRTAAEAGGLTGFETATIHVAVDHGREVDDLVNGNVAVQVHQTRHLTDADVQPARTPLRLRLPRAVVEAASDVAVRRPDAARAILAASVQQGLVRPESLRRFAVSRRTLPGRRLVLESIDDAAGGAHSLPEQQFLRGVRRAGLPEPRRQRVLQRPDGRWYLDNDFADFLVTVEVNGLQHNEQLHRDKDDFRRAVLQIGGRIVVDLSSFAVRHQIARCMLLTAEALQAHGYRPAPATRRRLKTYRARLGWDADSLRAS